MRHPFLDDTFLCIIFAWLQKSRQKQGRAPLYSKTCLQGTSEYPRKVSLHDRCPFISPDLDRGGHESVTDDMFYMALNDAPVVIRFNISRHARPVGLCYYTVPPMTGCDKI